MIRKYSLVMERSPSGFSAYLPELPSILIIGKAAEELRTRAKEAIQLYRELKAERSPDSLIDAIEVELPA